MHTYFTLPKYFIRLHEYTLKLISLSINSEERMSEFEHQRKNCCREGPQRKSGMLPSEKRSQII